MKTDDRNDFSRDPDINAQRRPRRRGTAADEAAMAAYRRPVKPETDEEAMATYRRPTEPNNEEPALRRRKNRRSTSGSRSCRGRRSRKQKRRTRKNPRKGRQAPGFPARIPGGSTSPKQVPGGTPNPRETADNGRTAGCRRKRGEWPRRLTEQAGRNRADRGHARWPRRRGLWAPDLHLPQGRRG